MEAEKKLFKIAGIMYGIVGVCFLTFPVYGLFLILCGVYFYTQANESEETWYRNRIFHYILAAIGIANLLGSILIFIAQEGIDKQYRKTNRMNDPPKVIYKRDKESRKIDILIKLGVAMVFIAGLLFATTTWDFINVYVKAFGLIGFGIIFLALSLFTESKLHLYRSAYMYWLLSMSLFLLTIVGILYFGIFGQYISYAGAGKNLAYTITFLTAAGFILTTYFKYPKKYLLFFCYGLMIISLSQLLEFANLSQMTNVSVISCVIMIINIIGKKQSAINTFSKILSYILFGAILVVGANNNIEGLIACFINIINLNYMTWVDKKKDESTINVLLTYVLIIFGLIKFTALEEFINCMIALVTTIYTLSIIGNIISTKKITKQISICTYLITLTTLFARAIYGYDFASLIASIGIPIILLGVNWIIKKGLLNVEQWKLANYTQPLIIYMLVRGLLNYAEPFLSRIYVFSFLSIIFAIMQCSYKNELDKKIVGAFNIFTIVIGLSFSITTTEMYASFMLIVSSLYMFTRYFLDQKKDSLSTIKLLVTYLILLTSIYLPFVNYNLLDLNVWIISVGYIVLILCMIPFLKNEWLKKISLVYLLVPFINLLNQQNIDMNLQLVLESIEKLYLIFLFLKFFVKDAAIRNVILIIGIIVCCYLPFISQSVYTGIYIGVLGIILILFGYKKDDAYPIFVTGIILTALNIIYYLKEVWKILPFWLYLLLGGLIIIFFATYKEIQKTNKSKK